MHAYCMNVCSVEQVTGKPAHPFLKRHIFFAHRELKEILDCYEKKIPFYLYTGRVGFVLCRLQQTERLLA